MTLGETERKMTLGEMERKRDDLRRDGEKER